MRKFLFLILALITLSCYEHERNCSDFKTGRFEFEYEIDGVIKTVFSRYDDIEIETFEGKTDTSDVRWVSDCEYVLTKKRPTTNEEKQGVSIKILNTSKNSYTFEFGMVGQAKKQRGVVTKIAD